MNLPLWSSFRPIGNSWVARLTILIPLVGYIIIFNDTLAHYLALITEVEGNPKNDFGLSVPPRLFQIYFGLCFIAVASAAYTLACPPVIKRHSSAGEYIAVEGVHLGEFASSAIEVLVAKTPGQNSFNEFRHRISNRISENFSSQEAQAEISRASLQAFFDLENARYPSIRAAVFLLYLVGISFLLIPALKIFAKVFFVLMRLLSDHGLHALW